MTESRHRIEVLEQRIAPAGILHEAGFKQATIGANLVLAGEGLTTGGGAGSGQYLLYVEKGTALVFITDLNNNSTVESNEVTGIAAGDGLSLISFVDIHGDIVTNLNSSYKLSDSDSNPVNNPPELGGDGLLLLNSKIDKIVLRTVQASDFAVNAITDLNGDGVVDDAYVQNRLSFTTFSIFGNIYAGGGIGSTSGGLVIDTAGENLLSAKFTGVASNEYYQPNVKPIIGSLRVGTTVSGKIFSFGSTPLTDVGGAIATFQPARGQAGGDIIGIKAASEQTEFNIGNISAGDGGIGARGGNIQNVQLNGDDSGYEVIAGNGGRGPTGGAGGSIINFSDLGSVTGRVIIQSGDGGVGSTGSGGAGGTISLGTMNVAGGVNVVLGDGGDGFTSGGNGASLTTAAFVPVDGGVPVPLNVTATAKRLLSIGSDSPIDFNNDGIADYVYSGRNPNQVVVVLGGLLTRFYLDAPGGASQIQVADFNNDGLDDVAVASSTEGNAAGVAVFYSNVDSQGDGSFSDAIYNTLPEIAGELQTGHAIGSLAAGDYNGDGLMDLAVVATYNHFNGANVVTDQYLVVLTNDNQGTGRFYADAGTSGFVKIPYFELATNKPTGSYIVKASVGSTADANDLMFVAYLGGGTASRSITTYQFTSTDTFVAQKGVYALGKVDSNRADQQGTSMNISLTDAEVLDFTILDFTGTGGVADGLADIAVLANSPAGFIVTVAGASSGVGAAVATSNPNAGGQNSGIYLGDPSNGVGGFDKGVTLKAIRTVGSTDVAILNYSSDTVAYTVERIGLNNAANTLNGLGEHKNTASSGDNANGRVDILAFDVYPGTGGDTYLTGLPNQAINRAHGIENTGPLILVPTYLPLVVNTINIFAGDGGAGLIGNGGAGGSLGGALKTSSSNGVTAVQGAVSIVLPSNIAFELTSVIIAGTGGNGFSSGGKGGSITGISTRYEEGTTTLYGDFQLQAGNGGFGVSGAGGAGGDLRANSIETGTAFIAGNGGSGVIGGKGGSVIGNGVKSLFDTQDLSVVVVAGVGGNGVKRGGDGGDISGFKTQADPVIGGGPFGFFAFIAGNGGSAAAGTGGRGGNIVNSSPLTTQNNMGGELYVEAGAGGDGTIGGAGGSVNSFINRPTQGYNPTVASILAGNGGNGTSGNGGVGGSIINVETPTKGVGTLTFSGYTFDRVIAGSGGASSSAKGGNGGSISNASVTTSDGNIVFAAGAGGLGLVSGGNGGSVVNAKTTTSSTVSSKVLVIAGAGGDAYASVPGVGDLPLRRFGGKIGVGGNGGNITGFKQESIVQARVDLIAGNGGDTVNYGTILSKSYVGRGGSISNVTIEGNIGSGHAANFDDPTYVVGGVPTELGLRANAPIKSYTDLDNDGVDDVSVDTFVQTLLRQSGGLGVTLDDNLGNVGLVVGVAGSIQAKEVSPGVFVPQPAGDGINGSVSNVSARNLLAAVAGSVNEIAAIQSISGLRIGSGSGTAFAAGVVGSDKDPNYAPFVGVPDPTPGSRFDYIDRNGNGDDEAQLGGRLIDGAVVAKAISGFLSGRVYIR